MRPLQDFSKKEIKTLLDTEDCSNGELAWLIIHSDFSKKAWKQLEKRGDVNRATVEYLEENGFEVDGFAYLFN